MTHKGNFCPKEKNIKCAASLDLSAKFSSQTVCSRLGIVSIATVAGWTKDS